MDNIKNYVQQHKDRFINELIELLKIPSVSADSAYSQDVINTAEAVKASLEKAGDPAIFELGDAEFRLEHGKGHHHAENVAGEVVEDGADGDESDHPPAQCPQASDPRQW